MTSPLTAPRTAVVTGGSSGIGLAVARGLAKQGIDLVLVARREAPLARAAAELGAATCVADVATSVGVDAVVRAVRTRFEADAPDLLVNGAGSFLLAPLVETSAAEFDAQLGANLRAPFLLMRAFLPAMLARGSGHVVTIGSVAGRQAFPHNGAYAASKFGVRGLHAVLAAELRGTGVRASLIEPAATDTPIWADAGRHGTPDLPARSAMLAPDAVADAVVYAATRPGDVAIPNLLVERS